MFGFLDLGDGRYLFRNGFLCLRPLKPSTNVSYYITFSGKVLYWPLQLDTILVAALLLLTPTTQAITLFRQMTTQLKTVPFYLQAWTQDEFIRTLTARETGIYWKLLVFQAEHGSISSDLEAMSVDIGVSVEELCEDWPKLSGKFQLGDDGRLRNRKMQTAIEYAEFQYKKRAAQEAAEAFRQARRGYYVTDRDMEKILSIFPARAGNPRDGHTKAMSMIRAAVHSDEDLERLISAITAYKGYLAKTYKSKSDLVQFTKRIDKWLESWQDWVPEKPPAKEAPAVQIPDFKSVDEELAWKRQQGMLSKYPPGSRFPWEPRYGATPLELKAIKERWTDSKKREAVQ